MWIIIFFCSMGFLATGLQAQTAHFSYAQTTVASGFTTASAVATDADGNVYIADSGNSEVVKETFSGGKYTQSVVADAATNGLKTPVGVAVDGNGNVYIADSGNQEILKETFSGGKYTQSVVADAAMNGLNNPVSVAVDKWSNVYLADQGTGQVLKLALSGVDFGTVPVGTSTAAIPVTFTFDTGGTIQSPSVLTMGAASLDFTDNGTGSCDTNGTSYTYAANDTCTVNVVFKPTVAGTRDGAVVLTSSGGVAIATAYVYGTGQGPQVSFSPPSQTNLAGGSVFTSPSSVAVDGSGNIYVTNSTFPDSLQELSPGCLSTSCVTTLNVGLTQPFGVAVDGAGNIYVADLGSNSVDEIPRGCVASSCVIALGGGTGSFNQPVGVAVDGSGNVYVANYGGNTVQEMPPGCKSSSCVTDLGGNFGKVHGVAVDGNGNVYVADYGNGAVVEMPPNCTSASCKTLLGGGNSSFAGPTGIAVDAAGNVYVAQLNGAAVAELSPGCVSSSCVSSVTGTFTEPIGVDLDGTGNLYVADYSANTVSELDRAEAPSLSFATTAVGQTSTDSPKSVTISNIGNGTLTFPIPTGAGAYNPSVSSNFAYNSSGSTCVQNASSASSAYTLSSDASCIIAINFTPVTAGTVNGSATLTDNNENAASPSYATQVINLSGTATAVRPGAPTIGTAVAGNAQATVSFTPPTFTGGTAITAYTATSSPGGLTGTCTSSPCTVTGLTNGTTYTFTVTATNSVGIGPPSAASNAVTPTNSQTITFNQPGAQVYGTTPTLTATASSGLTVVFTTGSPSVCGITSGGLLTTVSVGTCVINANQSGDTTYAAAPQVTQSFAITAAPLSVTVNNASRAYGAANPTFTGTVTGTVNGDTAASIGLTYSTTATASSPVGTYPITASITSTNYTLTVTPGTLTVTAAPLSVTVNNASRAYGAANPTFTGTVTGTVNGDTAASIGLTYSTTATASSPVGTYPITASITSTNYTLTVTPGTLTVTGANLVVSANNVTKVYGAVNPTFTGTVSGAINGDTFTESFSTTATTNSNIGQYPIVPTVTGANLSNYTVIVQDGTLTITQAGSAVSITSSTSSANLNANVTFTAMVTSLTSGSPTGSVEFLDGSTVLGSATLNASDTATFTTNSLSAGLHKITALYSGDQDFSGATSAPLAEIITAPDFSLMLNPTSLTLKPGQSGVVTVQFVPMGGFTGTATFSCSGLPVGATCAFSPAQLSADGSNTTVSTKMTISTTGPNQGTVAMNRNGSNSGGIVMAGVFWLPSLLFGGFLWWQRRKLTATHGQLLMMVLLVSLLAGTVGCGVPPPNTGPGTSTITVTATGTGSNGAPISHSVTFILTIQP
jgi:sugar lactone lactonase YvrE